MALDIALPFYGDVEFMKQTVQSILNQTDPNWRLVVVDDGTMPELGIDTGIYELGY